MDPIQIIANIYASLFLKSLYLPYNNVHLYMKLYIFSKTKINRVCGLETYTFYEYISEYFFRDFLVKIFPAKVPSIQDYGLMIEDQKDITFFSLTSIFAP